MRVQVQFIAKSETGIVINLWDQLTPTRTSH